MTTRYPKENFHSSHSFKSRFASARALRSSNILPQVQPRELNWQRFGPADSCPVAATSLRRASIRSERPLPPAVTVPALLRSSEALLHNHARCPNVE